MKIQRTVLMSQRHKKWPIIFGIWLVAGILYAAQSYYYRSSIGQAVSWSGILMNDASYFVLWFCFTPWLLWVGRRFYVDRTQGLARIATQVVLAIATAIIHRALYDLIFMPLRQTPERPFTWARFYYSVIGSFDYGVLVYGVAILVIHAIAYHHRFQQEQVRNSQLQAELATAQLQALRMQLHPHFLFNTLNTIAVLIKQDANKALHMVELLGDLLRQALKNQQEQEIPLQQELEFLQHYLQIEAIRFGDRLQVHMHTDPETLTARVPRLILQPLAENAIRHGLAKHRRAGVIKISALRQNGELQLRVSDNGEGPNAGHGKDGIGLSNTRARLQTLYGEHGRFELAPGENGGAVATIVIPFAETILPQQMKIARV